MAPKRLMARFKFDDVKNLLHALGADGKWSDEVADEQGNKWTLRLHPGGRVDNGSTEDDPIITLSLWNTGANDVNAKIEIIMRNAVGNIHLKS